MRTDPDDQDFILLDSDQEAEAAFRVGLITMNPEYVVKSSWRNGPCIGWFSLDKKYIRAKRDEEKIKEMLKWLGIL